MIMRNNPHILEISAHVWLKQIEAETGSFKTLDKIPQEYLQEIKDLKFDAVWLMGVWQESPESRRIAREDKDINNYLASVRPNYKKEDIIGSQYSIYDYRVNDKFGGDAALLVLKKRLNDLGIALILDFAGNHLSLDHPLTLSEPEMFINLGREPYPEEKPFFFKTKDGRWLAYGRDPHFPAWTDSVQINYFNPKARKFLNDTLTKIAPLCDGLRCDMVMLVLNNMFKTAWGKYIKEPLPQEEFWTQAIKKIKSAIPRFVFIAEVYWGLEWEVQEQGFDYTYDKILYDRLLGSCAQDIQGHLNAEHLYQKRSIRFIANHDEESPLAAFGKEKSMAASAIISTIDGARLFTAAQLYGAKRRLPIQYIPADKVIDENNFNFYKKLLDITNHPCFHGGQWGLKTVKPIDENDTGYKNILAWKWLQFTTAKLVLINYSSQISRCILPLEKLPEKEKFLLTEEISGFAKELDTQKVKKEGVLLDFAPYEVKIISHDL